MKIILFGSNGMLGSYLKTYLSKNYDVISFTRKDIEITNITEFDLNHKLKNIVNEGDIIINAAGVIKQRTYKPFDMIMVNSLFPQLLANIKDKLKCNIIHITTDCVFSGNDGFYNELSKHDCLDDYGKSKSLGENHTLTNIRTSIIGEETENKKSLLEWVRSNKGKTIDGYENHTWNGVTCLELAKLINRIIETNNFWVGTKHVFSPDSVTKYELVDMINKIYGLGISINKKTTEIPCFRTLSTISDVLITKPLIEQITEMERYYCK